MNRSYQTLANFYDELMSDIPYDRYVEIIELTVGGLQGIRVLDVGCGTGHLAIELAKRQAIVTAIDRSPHMLSIAKARMPFGIGQSIDWKECSMENITFCDIFDLVIIPIDALNYLPNQEKVLQTFKNIYRSLRSGGRLLFDVHSLYKMEILLMEAPFTFDNDRITYIWETEETPDEFAVLSNITFFIRQPNGLYARETEEHVQRTYPIHDYVHLLMTAGFTIERIFADFVDEAPTEQSERIFFQVRK